MSFDPNARLSSGMKVSEAVERARAWWDETGRHLIPQHLNRVDETRVSVPRRAGLVLRVKDVRHDLPSGILRGLAWDDLTRGEKLDVVRAWHHERVVVPLSAPTVGRKQ